MKIYYSIFVLGVAAHALTLRGERPHSERMAGRTSNAHR